jgi:hypothetical protein
MVASDLPVIRASRELVKIFPFSATPLSAQIQQNAVAMDFGFAFPGAPSSVFEGRPFSFSSL